MADLDDPFSAYLRANTPQSTPLATASNNGMLNTLPWLQRMASGAQPVSVPDITPPPPSGNGFGMGFNRPLAHADPATAAAQDYAARRMGTATPVDVGDFISTNPQYAAVAQRDPVGFTNALQTHVDLAHAAAGQAQGGAPAQPAPAQSFAPPSADGNAALGLPAGYQPFGLPGARPGSAAANAALGLPTGFNRADPNHIAQLASAHGLAPQQAHAMMNTSGYDLPSFLNATHGMTIGQFKTMMSLSRQQSPSELALGQYYSRALADRQKINDQYPESDKTKAADAARAAADLKLNQVLYGISVGARMGMGGPDTNQ